MAGAYLFLMQMHGYEHNTNTEENDGKAESIQLTKSEVINKVDWTDTIIISIPARGEKEYKLLFPKDSTFEYSWETNGINLFYDFHGEPKGNKTGYFKSFKKSTESKSNGSLTTLFEGTHGWYWKNNTSSSVDVVLKIKGDYQRLDLNKIQNNEHEQTSSNKQHDSIF